MPAAGPYTDELQRAIEIRASSICSLIAELQGSTSRAKTSLHKAFRLFGDLEKNVTNLVSKEINDAADNDSLAPNLCQILRHLTFISDFVEKRLTYGERRELSQALSDELSEELRILGLSQYNVIVSHGEANNYKTTYGNMDHEINGPLDATNADIPNDEKHFALFSVPPFEGSGIFWKPILIGHEVAHVYVFEYSIRDAFDLRSQFDLKQASTIQDLPQTNSLKPVSLRLYEIANNWLKEAICDFYSLLRYGPASIPAIGEYFSSAGDLYGLNFTHPPGILRLHLLLKQCGSLTNQRLRGILDPWNDIASTAPQFQEEWARFLVDFFVLHAGTIHSIVSTFPPPAYSTNSSAENVCIIADQLADGIAGIGLEGDNSPRVQKADIVNAAWLARSEQVETSIDALARKSVESLSFIEEWTRSEEQIGLDSRNGTLSIIAQALVQSEQEDQIVEDEGMLSQTTLLGRLGQGDEDSRLTITPLLQIPKGSSVDLRLGCRFIIFRRTHDTSFDPLDLATDPRIMQIYRELSWTERIVLHPQEMILASTLEYLALPSDLTAQVITRSSYGRLGLLGATAIQVHPNFHGCLTLELANLSNLPLVLTPGERVAQLVIWRTDRVEPADEKYHCPVGPEFSKVRTDTESNILRAIREGKGL